MWFIIIVMTVIFGLMGSMYAAGWWCQFVFGIGMPNFIAGALFLFGAGCIIGFYGFVITQLIECAENSN